MITNEKLRELYDLAREKGLCRRQKEFAALIGTDQSTVSHCLKGDEKYSKTVETLVCRAKAALFSNGVGSSIQVGDNNSNGIDPKNFANEDRWFVLVAEKDRQIDRLLSIIEGMNRM